MARVARAGGRVVAYEPDWETLVLDVPDRIVTRAVLQLRCDSIRNGWMGRQLFGLFQRADLEQIAVQPMTSTLGDHARAVALFELETYLERAQAAGLVTAVAAATWREQLARAAGQERSLPQLRVSWSADRNGNGHQYGLQVGRLTAPTLLMQLRLTIRTRRTGRRSPASLWTGRARRSRRSAMTTGWSPWSTAWLTSQRARTSSLTTGGAMTPGTAGSSRPRITARP